MLANPRRRHHYKKIEWKLLENRENQTKLSVLLMYWAGLIPGHIVFVSLSQGSSTAELLFCKQAVVGSNPTPGLPSKRDTACNPCFFKALCSLQPRPTLLNPSGLLSLGGRPTTLGHLTP